MARARKEGEAYVAVHADTDPFVREAEAGIREGADRAERDLKDTGDQWGETLSEAMGARLEKEGPRFAKSLEKGLGSQKVNVPIKPDYHTDRSAARKVAAKLAAEIEEAVLEAGTGGGGGGGPFGKVGQAFADAIGAGFNVSGKSPLIAFLVPLIGAIAGLVIAAIQAVNALVAVLVTLPGILAAVGLQAGVVMIAFEGMGKAIQGAFAAKNANELKLALKGLAPAAQDFVKSLLPLKEFFYQLRFTVQQNFFDALGKDLIPQLLKFQGNRILRGFQELAKAMGSFFHDLGFFFNSDAFTRFLDEVFPRTITFLEQFGPSFITFLEGLINLANAAMPFMTEVGGIVSMVFKQMGDFFTATANDPQFLTWLTEMRDTLDEVVTFVKIAFVFIGQLMDSINRAGGESVITQLSMSLALIGDFLSSDVGVKAMEAFINVAIVSIQVVTGLIIAILAIAGAAQKVGEYIENSLLGDIGGFFQFLWDKIVSLWNSIKSIVNDFVAKWQGAASSARQAIANFATSVRDKVSEVISNIVGLVRSVPDRVRAFFADAKTWLLQAGRNLIQGFIDGVRSMFSDLWNTMKEGAGIIAGFMPHSPAKEGPLSGKGDTLYSGQKIVQRLAAGMEMEAPLVSDAAANVTSNITFGPNSIQMRFTGLPNDEQSRGAGNAVAQGIYSGLARDTRLAVRTL